MIILVRHAQSEGNLNRDVHQTIPDHRIKLTVEGHRQAHEAGHRLRALLRPDDRLQFFTSPYRRARETTEGILSSLTSDYPSPAPFQRRSIKIFEEPRLREQDFGNFQPCSAEMERMWQERADYGHFFYRIPNGESAADAYDRVSGFHESLWRLFGEDDFASVCVLVTHGLMTRIFLMKWYHWSVEYFEDLRNINHCEFVIMKLNPENGKYLLLNKLRTWSELRMERERELPQNSPSKGMAPAPSVSDSSIPTRREWRCGPNGCNHGDLEAATITVLEQTVISETTPNIRHQREIHDLNPMPAETSSAAQDIASRQYHDVSENSQPGTSTDLNLHLPGAFDHIPSPVKSTRSPSISLADPVERSGQETPFMLSSDEEQQRAFDFLVAATTNALPSSSGRPASSSHGASSRSRRTAATDPPPTFNVSSHDGGMSSFETYRVASSSSSSNDHRPHDGANLLNAVPRAAATNPSNLPFQDLEHDGDDEADDSFAFGECRDNAGYSTVVRSNARQQREVERADTTTAEVVEGANRGDEFLDRNLEAQRRHEQNIMNSVF